RRDAEGEKRAALRLAEIGLQMRVKFRETGHHGEVRRVDDLRAGTVRIVMWTDADDLVAFDDDVDVRTLRRALHVEELARVNDDSARRHRGRVFQIERHRTHLARFDVDESKLV